MTTSQLTVAVVMSDSLWHPRGIHYLIVSLVSFLGSVQDHRMCYVQLTNKLPSLEIIQVKSGFCFTKTFQEPDYLDQLIHHCSGSILSKKSMLPSVL